jgi:glutathione peroxidase
MTIHVVRRTTALLLLLIVCGAVVYAFTANPSKDNSPMASTPSSTSAAVTSIHEFTMNDIDGKPKKLDSYKGSVVLVVNVASKCGYTPQYEGLEKVYKQYKDKGFVVLGFPANNFMGQEPGTEAEIKQFCSSKYNVTFPMFSKISVKGSDMHPLYQYLTQNSAPTGDVKWNFGKFLVGKDGKVIARFDSGVKPDGEELTLAIEKAMK